MLPRGRPEHGCVRMLPPVSPFIDGTPVLHGLLTLRAYLLISENVSATFSPCLGVLRPPPAIVCACVREKVMVTGPHRWVVRRCCTIVCG